MKTELKNLILKWLTINGYYDCKRPYKFNDLVIIALGAAKIQLDLLAPDEDEDKAIKCESLDAKNIEDCWNCGAYQETIRLAGPVAVPAGEVRHGSTL